MSTFSVTRVKRLGALGLTLAMLFPPAGGLLTAAQAQGPAVRAAAPLTPPLAIKSILIFPFVNNAGAAGDPVAARVADAVKLRVNAVGSFTATSYSTLLAPVQRALTDNVLSRDDVTPPFSDKQKAGHVAQQVAADAYLIGSVESYSADPTTKKVTIEVSAILSNTNTGETLRTLAFSGSAAPVSPVEDQDSVTQSAINDVASRIASALNASAPKAIPVPPQVSKRSSFNPAEGVLLTLLVGAAVYAIAQHHGGGGGSSSSSTPTNSGGPPSPPVTTTTGSGGPPAAPTIRL